MPCGSILLPYLVGILIAAKENKATMSVCVCQYAKSNNASTTVCLLLQCVRTAKVVKTYMLLSVIEIHVLSIAVYVLSVAKAK